MKLNRISKLTARFLCAASCVLLVTSNAISGPAAYQFDMGVAEGKLGKSIGGDLYIAADDTMNKIGAGTLLLSGDHRGNTAIKGKINIVEGILQFDNVNSFGDAAQVLLMDGATIQAGDTQSSPPTYDVDNCVLTKPIVLNNLQNADISCSIDCNDHSITLPAITAINTGYNQPISLHIKNSKELLRKVVSLGANYTATAGNDVMIVGKSVDLQVSNVERLAPILGVENGAKVSLLGDMTLKPLSLYTAAAACTSTIECNNHAITLGAITSLSADHTGVLKFLNSGGEQNSPKVLTLGGAFTKGAVDDKIEIASTQILSVTASNQLPPKLDMGAGSVLRLTGDGFSLPDIAFTSVPFNP